MKKSIVFIYNIFSVMKEITSVFFDSKFIDSLMKGSLKPECKLLTYELCKFLLKDVALSSRMQLDQNSMDKLWNLMVMVYKWQLCQTTQPHHLIDITFRHLDGVLKLFPNPARFRLVDFVKNLLLDFWNAATDAQQAEIYKSNKSWLQPFNVRVSLLVRLGFQQEHGGFLENVQATYFEQFAASVGENIYEKAVQLPMQGRQELTAAPAQNQVAQQINTFSSLFNAQATCGASANEVNLQHCNLIFNSLSASTDSTYLQLQTEIKRK